MNVLIDTNVLLDIVLERKPFVDEAAQLYELARRKRLTGSMAAISVTTVHYLTERSVGRISAARAVELLLEAFEVAPVGRAELEAGAGAGFERDYEDGVIHAAAVAAGCAAIVTRDRSGFAASRLAIYSPGELLAVLARS